MFRNKIYIIDKKYKYKNLYVEKDLINKMEHNINIII